MASGSYSHIMEALRQSEPAPRACNCRGPQDGQPVCPCMMRDVRVIDGRYMRLTDLGPAPASPLLKHIPLRTPEYKLSWKD